MMLFALSAVAFMFAVADDTGRHRVEARLEELNTKVTEDRAAGRKLKCDLCHIIASDVFKHLQRTRNHRNKPLPETDVVELLETYCDSDELKAHGLKFENDLPTLEFTNNPKWMKATGGWVDNYKHDICGKIYNDHSEHVTSIFEKERNSSAEQFSESACCRIVKKGCCKKDKDL